MNQTFEQSILADYIEQLLKQFPQYSKVQQHKVLETVRAVVVEPKGITKHRPTQAVLDDMRVQIEEESRAGLLFKSAFPVWYRESKDSPQPRLFDFCNLDLSNRHLFFEMLCLRDSGHFDDEALYQFEQYCLES